MSNSYIVIKLGTTRTRQLVVPDAVAAGRTKKDFRIWDIDFRKFSHVEEQGVCAMSDRTVPRYWERQRNLNGDGQTYHPTRDARNFIDLSSPHHYLLPRLSLLLFLHALISFNTPITSGTPTGPSNGK